MKKLTILIIGVLSMSNVMGQDIADALRYSQDDIQGTARFRALSGAFGALGGDLSAINLNPASSAIFNRSYSSLTLSSLNINNDATYFNESRSSSDTKLDLNQAGGVFVFKSSNENASWKKFALSVAYDKTANFSDNWSVSGVNTNSIDQYFLAYAQGLRLDEISAFPGESYGDAYAEIGTFYGFGNQQAFLGYESFILEPEDDLDENTVYTSNIGNGTFNQAYRYDATGYNGKIAFNAATQYEDKLYLGVNLNAHFINYERFTGFSEANSNEGSIVTNVNFDNTLITNGNGFSFQLGAILKVTKDLRAGFTYNSPTWFTIYEETTQVIATSVNDLEGDFPVFIDPSVINVFPEYRLQSPGKITGSLAYVFGERGLLSFDYSRRNYKNIKFKPTSDAFFSSQNVLMDDIFKTAQSYRAGGEFKIKQFSFRGGYRFEESPYEDESFYGDLKGYSMGVGFNFGSVKLDLTYDHSERVINNELFSVGLTDAATIDSSNSNITLSLGFNI